jgi:hypothetical protein
LISAGWNLNPSLPASFYQAMESGNKAIGQPINGQRLYLSPNDEYLVKFARFFRFDDYSQIEDAAHLSQVMLPDINLLTGISSVNNFDPLVPARFARWMENLASLPSNQVLPWLNLMNVGTVERLEIDSPLGVSFDPLATPNAYNWTNCAFSTSGAEDAWSALNSELSRLPVGQPFRKVVLEEISEPAEVCDQTGSAMIDQTRVGNSDIRVIVSSAQNGWLVTSNTWYPGWIVQVDGQNVPLLHANYLFQSVWLPSGIHRVEFIYRPMVFYAGAGLSLLGLIGILVQTIGRRRSQKSL